MFHSNDGKRLMSLRGTARAMELSGGGSQALIRNLKSIYLQPYLTNDLQEWIIKAENSNIDKIRGIGNPFIPLEAELFVDICDAYKKAKNDGVFNGNSWKKQYLLAKKLDNMMTAFAKVGIIAFIDEITGYQEERKKDELQILLAEFVRKEYLPWTRRFPPIFYEEIYRLKDWDYSGKIKKTQYIGKITNQIVYDVMPKGVLEELQKKNPVDKKLKHRKYRHHQYLTEETGINYLDKHLMQIIALMQVSDTWEEFLKLFNKLFYKNEVT